jgi:hypothetical protein
MKPVRMMLRPEKLLEKSLVIEEDFFEGKV